MGNLSHVPYSIYTIEKEAANVYYEKFFVA